MKLCPFFAIAWWLTPDAEVVSMDEDGAAKCRELNCALWVYTDKATTVGHCGLVLGGGHRLTP